MTFRRRAVWALAIAGSILLLIAPAVWNGFPLLQFDTGGYLSPWYEHVLGINRSVPYGLLLVMGAPLDFWPVVVAQSAATVWVLALTLRAHRLGGRPWLLLALVAALCLLSTLPWLTGILLTDIFAGLGVLALYLLFFRDDTLGCVERLGLLALTAVAAATHSGTMLLLLGLVLCATIVWLIDSARIPYARIARAMAALLLGTAMVMTANWLVAGRFGWTPGGFALSFGRMLEDGIVTRYLNDHCPDRSLKLCPYRAELPNDADDFFWGESIFDKLGRFDGLREEMHRIALTSLTDYPWLQLKSIASETVKQLTEVETGAGVVNWIWNTYGVINLYAPGAVPAMRTARQQRVGISFDLINRWQVPIAWLAMALSPFVAIFALRRADLTDIGEFAATMTLAVFGNAAVFGMFATAHSRYGARIAWIAILVALIALARMMQNRSNDETPALSA
jgi:hypothetical protein